MPLPALAAAALASPVVGSALGAVGNVIGGILGKSAQKSANKMNYKIAQETNAANERIADRANALQYKMQQEQFDYASPARQREMLEAAGMNPYLYASQSAHAGSAPSVTTGAPQVAAQMMPENAFANSVSSATREFAETFGLLMDAKKKQAETEGQQLSNSVYLERFKTEMEALGLGNEYQSIVNRWADRKEELTVDNLLKSGLLTDAQVEETKVRQALGEDELKHLRPKMLDELIEKVGLLKEQQLSEQNEREFRNTTAKIGISNAATNRLLALVAQKKADSEIAVNEASAKNLYQQAYGSYLDNELKKRFGSVEKFAGFMQSMSNIQLTDANIKKALAEAGILQKEDDSWAVNKAIDNVKKILEAGKVLKDIFSPTP